MPIKKSELYSSIWKSCDELRGGMDASQYKDYVLVLLFVKYVSDKYAGQKDALLDVPRGGGFADMVALKGDKEIGDKMNKIIAKLAEANDLKGIVVLDKEHAAARKGIFMVDASKGFIKDGNKNRLRAQDIHKIVDAFTRQLEIPGYSSMVPLAKIEANDFNLNLPRYIPSSESEDLQDIDAHLRGNIPVRDLDALDAYWQVFPAVRRALLGPADHPGYSRLQVAVADIKATIFGHAEFTAFNQSVTTLFDTWKHTNAPRLEAIAIGDKPKALIETLAEDLLETFRAARLLDAYDVYQHLMDYWAETMQDDVYMIASDGWEKAAEPRLIIEDEDKKKKEKADFTIGKWKLKAELVPPPLMIARYFSAEHTAIESLGAQVAAIEHKLEELKEEHGGEDGLLADVLDDKGNISRAAVMTRLKESKQDADAADELNSGTLGKVHFVEKNFWPHNTSLWVTDFKGNDPRFICYLLTSIRLQKFGSGSGVPTLNRNDVHAVAVSIPPSRIEQAAIAAVLSDMDAEIAALEARRDKTRALKQGMMQELLTGRVRLPIPVGEADATIP